MEEFINLTMEPISPNDDQLKQADLPAKCSIDENDKKRSDKIDSKEFIDFKNDLIILKKQIKKLKKKLNNQICKNNILKKQLDQQNPFHFKYVVRDIKQNLSYSYFSKTSKEFTFCGIDWYIHIETRYFTNYLLFKTKDLAFYLGANETDDKKNVEWEYKVTGELILKNNQSTKKDLINKINSTFESSFTYGSSISEEELLNSDNGFVKDDSIEFEVNLYVLKIDRKIEK